MTDDLKKYVRFGTSSWAYEGWKNIVYFKDYENNKFKKDCLAEYAADKRFSTVGMDLFFYQPPTENLLQYYGDQLPAEFITCSKVWEELTIYRFPDQHRLQEMRNKLNPHYLNASIFIHTVLKPYEQVFAEHTGPFIFEFQYIKKTDKTPVEFSSELDIFFSELPRDFQYAVEIRNKNFLTPQYFEILKKHRVAHLFNQWSYMPSIRQQLKYNSITADFLIARFLTPAGMNYQQSLKKFEPFDKIIDPQPKVREDALKLIEIAIKEKKYAYLLINNRLEGCAPLSVEALIKKAEQKYK